MYLRKCVILLTVHEPKKCAGEYECAWCVDVVRGCVRMRVRMCGLACLCTCLVGMHTCVCACVCVAF